MSGLGHLRFLPWARRGLATAITAPPPDAPSGRAQLTVKLRVATEGASPSARDVDVRLPLYGPGDVIGIDARQIIRTEPRPHTHDFEPNYLAAIEFDSPYYPWLFSPDVSSTRMRPWLCLVVLRRDRADLSADPQRPLPSVSIALDDAPKELPDLAQAWAWAHVQLTGGDPNVKAALEGAPESTLSRLVCPRRLEANTAYLACLVPVLAAGRDAGLGLPVRSSDDLAWPPYAEAGASPGRFELPVYHSWEFTTSPLGDFETLVRRLVARPLDPAEAGTRAMDLSTAGAGLPVPPPGEPGSTLGFEGALGVPSQQPGPWPAQPKADFQAALRARLEAAPEPGVTRLTPPVYGHHQAGLDPHVPADGEPPRWLRELNLDPRCRGAAALGTKVVQDLQEQLVASAWDQAGALERANGILRQAQMARAVAGAAHVNRLKPLAADAADVILRLTSPLHRRVRVTRDGTPPAPTDPGTLRGSMRTSAFPRAAVSAPFRRALRPGGPVGRWVPSGPGAAAKRMSRGLAKGQLEVPIRRAHGAVEFDAVDGGRRLGDVKGRLGNARGWNKITIDEPAETGHPFYEPAPAEPPGPPLPPADPDGPPIQPPDETGPARPPDPAAESAPVTAATSATRSATASAAPAAPPPSENGNGAGGGSEWELDEIGERRKQRLQGINARFKEAADALHAYLDDTMAQAAATPRPDLELDGVAQTLVEDGGPLDPERTVAEQVLALVPPPPADAPDPLMPRAATPRFPQPMWEPLRRLSQDFLLPGADSIKPDTITLLGGNARFIEAYMVGLNHELSRELLWRGMPVDYGATYFRQFWDVRGRGPTGGVTPRADIPDIAAWKLGSGLGDSATGVGGAGMLVLLLRGELLRRYPTTAVYAVKGQWTEPASEDPAAPPRGRRPGGTELYPEFRGDLEPDIVFLGFPLTVGEARGSAADAGWYFVLQEQPTAPRFGFDELKGADATNRFGGRPGSWSALDWGHLVSDEAAYLTMTHVPIAPPLLNPELLAPPLGDATWGHDSAHMAQITLQQPVRIAVHASRMLGDAEDLAQRVTRATSSDGVVRAIGGRDGDGQPWQLSADAAIGAIERGARAFFVQSDGGERHALRAREGTQRRLTAAAGPGEPNLLLVLPAEG